MVEQREINGRLNHNKSIISFLNIYPPLLVTLASYTKRGQPVTTTEIAFRLEWALCRIISNVTSAVVETVISHGCCGVLILLQCSCCRSSTTQTNTFDK